MSAEGLDAGQFELFAQRVTVFGSTRNNAATSGRREQVLGVVQFALMRCSICPIRGCSESRIHPRGGNRMAK